MNTPGDSTPRGTLPPPHPTSTSSQHFSNVRPPTAASAGGPGFSPTTQMTENPSSDLAAWHSAYRDCQWFFINRAQHSGLVQSVAALVNIRLPSQWPQNPVASMLVPSAAGGVAVTSPNFVDVDGGPRSSLGIQTASANAAALPYISLVPYVRRLIVTGFDTPDIMHNFFGNNWIEGVGAMHRVERRNYMFTAKSVSWAHVKRHYDGQCMDETVPFMKPLQHVRVGEVEKGEQAWSEWMCMEDWMVGPHAPQQADVDMESGNAGEDVPIGGSAGGNTGAGISGRADGMGSAGESENLQSFGASMRVDLMPESSPDGGMLSADAGHEVPAVRQQEIMQP